jgi:hypothetical protein
LYIIQVFQVTFAFDIALDSLHHKIFPLQPVQVNIVFPLAETQLHPIAIFSVLLRATSDWIELIFL